MTIARLLFSLSILMGMTSTALAADPTATHYTLQECQGSAMPYPVSGPVTQRTLPDSLQPVFINHVSRHGARFLSSSRYTTTLQRYLHAADSAGTITRQGRELQKLCQLVVDRTAGRWGALDSLGMDEQRGIASRLYSFAPTLFHDTRINAISSYVPRCVASMDEFTHQLTRLDNRVEIYTSSGRQNSPLMRPWGSDSLYKAYIAAPRWHEVEEEYSATQKYGSVADRVMGASYPYTPGERDDIARSVFKVVTGCAAMGIDCDLAKYLTSEEANALWSIENLSHYLTHSASTLSPAPMELATDLLTDLINTLEEASKGQNEYAVMLRFGHAETMMPLLALMRIQGCYYMTNYFDTVAQHWKDFYVVPMASNIQMFLLRANSGRLYLRVDLNESPVPLIPGRTDIYTPLPRALEYLTRCLPGPAI